MAWNPSPEVQVARDVAIKIGSISNTKVRQVVIIYITESDQLGTISYGEDVRECADAKKLSDKLYERTMAHFS